MLISEVFK